MESKTNRPAVLAFTAVGAVAGFLLRRWQLHSAFDEAGLVIRGSASSWVLGIVCAVLVVALAFLSRRLPRKSGYEESFSSGMPEMLISVIAAVLLLAGSALELLHGTTGKLALVVHFLGVCSALCILVTAMQRYRGVVPPVAVHILPCLYLVIKLIADFKQWSVDPAVLDYCFELFAAIAAMCAIYHLGGFCFDKGGRRISVFWCLSCLVFSVVALADGGLTHTLLIGGVGLWAGVNGWQLLED